MVFPVKLGQVKIPRNGAHAQKHIYRKPLGLEWDLCHEVNIWGVGGIHFGGFICHLSGIHILALNCYCTKKDECHGYSSSHVSTCRLKADFNQTLMLIKPELLDSIPSIHLIFQHFTLAIFKLNYAIMNGFIVGKCVYKDTSARNTVIAIWCLATGRYKYNFHVLKSILALLAVDG